MLANLPGDVKVKNTTDFTLEALCFMSMVRSSPLFYQCLSSNILCLFRLAMLLETWKLYFPPIKLSLWKSIHCLKVLCESFKALTVHSAFLLHPKPEVTVWKESIVGRLRMPRFGLKDHLIHLFLLDALFSWMRWFWQMCFHQKYILVFQRFFPAPKD